MRLIHGITAAAIALAMLPGIVGCSRQTEVIPKSDLAQIYADMFLADQWIANNGREKRVADTSHFYNPIFEKYGYTFADYDASVTYYLQHPERYARVFKAASAILDRERKRLQKIEDAYNNRRKWEPFTPPRIVLRDSLAWSRDTSLLWSIIQRRALAEALLAESLVRDSLTLDSLRRDSLILDSLRLDSLRLDSLRLDSLQLDSLDIDTLSRDTLKIDTTKPILNNEPNGKIEDLLLPDGPDDPAHAGHARKRKIPRGKDK